MMKSPFCIMTVFPFCFHSEAWGKYASKTVFGPIFRAFPTLFFATLVIFFVTFFSGCNSAALKRAPYSSFEISRSDVQAQNPLPVRGDLDPFQVWETVVDVVRLYFDRIEDEYPCQRSGETITEGLLRTVPQTGSTCFEPWRRDSVSRSERQYATVQSVRRIAKIRVRHADGKYIIHVRVDRELEDLAKPTFAVLPSATFRLDTQIPETDDPIGVQDYHEGWIPQGRDYALEQTILNQLQLRLDSIAAQSVY
ncbi:MAG: hypothetical protein Q4C70_09975 [Planctomycetia bacterium]|nr:hypothetical protein [Planctomycetia bacterium]